MTDDPFAEIRPYRDHEVVGVLSTLLDDDECLDAIARLRLGKLAAFAPAVWRYFARRFLRKQLRGVSDVRTLQMVIKTYMDGMIERTSGGFTVSGLEQLARDQAYLFVSNHRDIALDPAFTNFALHTNNYETVRIAIGDNLLTKPWVSKLMRLNKSFIVKRSVSGPRELLAASKTLSSYIHHSVTAEKAPVWIAQREGRAKDGLDKTEPAIIKMLAMSRDKSGDFSDYIAQLRIVPVAISYELDPCDALKANELHKLASEGVYEKDEQEDIASIGQGIAGQKGRVHVSFGTPLGDGFNDAGAVAAELDRQIWSEFRLHPTNLYAYEMLYGKNAPLPTEPNLEEGDCSRAEFEARIAAFPEAQRPYALGIYANAVVSKLPPAG